ncbi:MAG: beta-galactosidase, partial [Prevotella sp.]|nr:beta-galactosidase [Prevotella sp.]
YMTYVCYNGKGGTDGRGYETWLAKSDDLLHWETLGRILAFGQKGWDLNQRGGFPSLIDYQWGGSYNIEKFKNRYWMTYIGGPGSGYEAVNAPLSIGLASTEKDVGAAHQWKTYSKPILSYDDKDAQWWEKMTQYKSTIYEVDKEKFGYRFMMFYNAGGKDETHPKGERIGIAFSNDLKKWKRYDKNPIFAHDSDGTITGDAQIVKYKDLYIMFYFSAFNPTRSYNAFNTFAVSRDMISWQDWEGEDLITPSKPYDELFAHKSYVVYHDGVVYHFYCAVNNDNQRGIALATSKPMGLSEVKFPEPDATGKRWEESLNNDWRIILNEDTFVKNVPINLDDYYGALQKEHGNLHGEALFKKTFIAPKEEDKQYFLRFEGVGTYAEVTLNSQYLGRFDIGRTTQTIDVSKEILQGEENSLEVKVLHPSGITDMPWVCGGCSSEYGFSEGSQPFGIFRPVTLEVTDMVRIEPFGVHVWNNEKRDSLFIDTEIHNYSDTQKEINFTSKICNSNGGQIKRLQEDVTLEGNSTKIIRQSTAIEDAHLWSQEDPYLYQLNSIIKREGKSTDELTTSFGIRSISFPLSRGDGDNRFLLNDKPVYINGVSEYEHMFGQSHAFSKEQIQARIKEVKLLGFNAFRDAHQPHHLLYQDLIDKEGILWWPQFSAHIWYDTPEFRESFKRHLIQWVKERRNCPSLILWGLQNESTLPKDFAQECSDIIREMDPTCGKMRLITTCNGGEGTDWNVVQNWSGTYGGNINNYAEELKRDDQLLNGEYGAWRTIGNHLGEGYFEQKQCDILEKKAILAESVKDSVCGQFLWPLQSHDNPGRTQPDEALRRIDKVGPFNYKGLLTCWEQPVDAFYLYRSRYTPVEKEPIVYIVPSFNSDSIRVYSNAEKVELSSGNWSEVKQREENSTLFKFKDVRLDENILTASAYQDGVKVLEKKVALSGYQSKDDDILKKEEGYTYLYRLNCGGDEYIDAWGNTWSQDNTQFSSSWGNRFPSEVSPYQTSQTSDSTLLVSPIFRSSRFGRHNLKFNFPIEPGLYRVELYFIEPWYGKESSDESDYEGIRLFDVAINDSVVIKDLDLYGQARFSNPYKRVVNINNTSEEIKIDFPRVNSSQAIISAIAIAKEGNFEGKENIASAQMAKDFWKNLDSDILIETPDSLLPPRRDNSISVEGEKIKGGISWNYSVGVAKVYALRFRYHNPEKERTLHVKITDANGVTYKEDDIVFLKTQEAITKRKNTSITTGTQTNAGTYTVTLTGDGINKMLFDKLTIE